MSGTTQAWMLRQDGSSFPVNVHIYCMGDEDLSSEAEAAAFLLYTDSDDAELAKNVLDAWMALLIENAVPWDATEVDIDNILQAELENTPYKFAYPLSTSTLISYRKECNNYTDIDSLYEYVDYVRDNLSKIQEAIRRSLNQQFCRVRYGGRLDSRGPHAGPEGSIWFRVSSAGYNWANTIYIWLADNYRKLHVNSVYICRDYESDNGDDYSKPDYFYKAKDGHPYYDMPIQEYFQEEHEHSPVFSTYIGRGVIASAKQMLASGSTFASVVASMDQRGIHFDSRNWDRFIRTEHSTQCIDASTFLDEAGTRTKMKVDSIVRLIRARFPAIDIDDVDCNPRPNRNGKMVGFEMIFHLQSDEVKELDGLDISVVYSKPFNTIPADSVAGSFSRELLDYCSYQSIDLQDA